MADFRETVQEHIDSMSPAELAATEARRLQREAGNTGRMVLEARWEAAPGAPPKEPETRDVKIEIEQPAMPGGDGILRIFEGAAFKETLLLTPAVYRVIAGGKTPGNAQGDRFIIAGENGGAEKVSVDRASLAAMLQNIRPAEIARAARLAAAEPRGPVNSAEVLQKRADEFTQNWAREIVREKIGQLAAKVPSRSLHLIVGKDYVSLTVKKEELLVGNDGFFKSPLAGAIIPPNNPPVRPAIIIAGDLAAFRDRDAPFLKNTFGTGPLRRLVLDVVKLGDIAAGLTPEERESALALLAKLIDRAAELNRELPPRVPVPIHPVAPAKRRRAAPPPPPVIKEEDEPAGFAMELEDIGGGLENEKETGLETVASLDTDENFEFETAEPESLELERPDLESLDLESEDLEIPDLESMDFESLEIEDTSPKTRDDEAADDDLALDPLAGLKPFNGEEPAELEEKDEEAPVLALESDESSIAMDEIVPLETALDATEDLTLADDVETSVAEISSEPPEDAAALPALESLDDDPMLPIDEEIDG